MTGFGVIVILISIAVILNIYAIFKLTKAVCYTKEQKTYQLLIIWFFPFIGAILVLIIMSSDQPRLKSTSPYRTDDSHKYSGIDTNNNSGGGD